MAKQTLTAFYDTREYANNAAMMLKQQGITDVTVSPAGSETGTYGETAGSEGKGFWASLEELFGGSDDHATYAEGLRRGAIMLVAHVDDVHVDEAVDILEQHGSVDMSEREATWRNDGWTGGAAVTGGGVASEGSGPLRSVAPLHDDSLVGKPATTTVSDRIMGTAAVDSAASMNSAVRSGGEDVLQVVEESLNVGKRAVNRGKVRLHSYVVETPVNESVTLHRENVSIDRRPVDRPVAAAELGADAFRDRTIEMDEVDEEAVVGKTARVVEEIGIRKDASDRTQTISDTVRSTKVDVDDGRTVGTKSGLIGGFTTEVQDDMEVIGSDGQHVGVVDHLDGSNIKLKKMDPASGGSHHLIPTSWVKSVDTKVTLSTTAADAKSRWTAA